MARPDRFPDPHTVPTQRRVVITALDKQYIKLPLETLLADRGFDLTLPYHQDTWDGEGDLYVQDIPPSHADH